MFKTLQNAWRIPELRKKIMFTMFILLIYRVGNAITVPYVNTQAVAETMQSLMNNTILGLYNVMSGAGLEQASVLGLGIQPYINASIIIQLLTVAIPALERWAKEDGEAGKKKIDLLTRISTVALGVLLGYGYYTILRSQAGILTNTGFIPALVIVLAFTAGSSIVMWMGNQITEHGIGNGISMILFANIIAGLPRMAETMIAMGWISILILLGLMLLIVFIVFINDAERRIPIQYAKRVVGRKVYGGQSTNLPIKVAMSGVMPVIFAQSIVSIPGTIYEFSGMTKGLWFNNIWSNTSWTYAILYFLLIFFFSWFYSQIQYDPVEISNNLKKNGGFIPGFRPGKPTSDFIKKVIGKIVIFGAIYLAVVALLPIIAGNLIDGFNYLAIGGTSIIILVGVALETVKALEAQMLMRHYKGFLD